MERYINSFSTENDIQIALDNGELLKPYVAYIEDVDRIDWNSKTKTDNKNNYLTFVALEPTTYSFNSDLGYSLQYSTDNGVSWNTLAATIKTPTIQTGDKVLWKGNIYGTIGKVGVKFSSTGKYEVEGNIMSLRYGDDFKNKVTLSEPYTFSELFYGDTKLISAENLVLPATTLADYCYEEMFGGCTSLTSVSVLPATTLARNCYSNMFFNCKSLTTAPELPATTLVQGCYYRMFYGCSSLTTAPALPATTLVTGCYYGMFLFCTKLNYIKCLATDISPTNCTDGWVNGVASTGTFVKNPNMTSWTTGNSGIPNNWTIQDA